MKLSEVEFRYDYSKNAMIGHVVYQGEDGSYARMVISPEVVASLLNNIRWQLPYSGTMNPFENYSRVVDETTQLEVGTSAIVQE